jgi:hypothetical protein
MIRASIAWFALGFAMALAVGGCGSLRQGESTSRCTDCATALLRDSGSGGTIYSIHAAGDAAAGRVARRYCAERGLGEANLGPHYASTMGSDFWSYDFSCGAQRASVAAPAPPVDRAPTTVAAVVAPTPPAATSTVPVAPAAVSTAGLSADEQTRQQQRAQAVRALRAGLDALPVRPSAQCAAPVTMWVRLPCGDVVSCTRTDDQVHCD